MKEFILTIGVIILAFSFAMADELVPATSDDISNFDNQIKNSVKSSTKVEGKSSNQRNNKKPKDNFGALVSAEAKNFKDANSEAKKGMGTWVSDQRRQDDQKRPEAVSNPGSGTSGSGDANSDAHAAAPNGHSNGKGNSAGNGNGNANGHSH